MTFRKYLNVISGTMLFFVVFVVFLGAFASRNGDLINGRSHDESPRYGWRPQDE